MAESALSGRSDGEDAGGESVPTTDATDGESPKPQWPTGPDEYRIVLEAIEAFREYMEVETTQQERDEVESVLHDFVEVMNSVYD